MSLFGWSLPPGCGKLPGEEDDGFRVCPKCKGDCEPPPDDQWEPVIDEDGCVDHCEATYTCPTCGHTFRSK